MGLAVRATAYTLGHVVAPDSPPTDVETTPFEGGIAGRPAWLPRAGGTRVSHRFANPDPAHAPHGARAILRWGVFDRLRGSRRRRPPGPPAPSVDPDLGLIRDRSKRARLTWIGHSSFLCGLGSTRFLIDPVFADHAGTLYPRFGAPGLAARDLPEVEAILLTHNHYDHLDSGAVRAVGPDVPVVAPLGMGGWLRRHVRRSVHELGWWQSVELDDLTVTLVPARHWSRRGVLDTNRALWGGYVVEGDRHSVYHAGDSAWFDGFQEIGRRFPGLSAALLPIGAYEPAWFMEHFHMNPEQAGRAFLELGAQTLVPMHWGSFQLADEPLCEPAERIRAWWHGHAPENRRLAVIAIGETVVLE
jgi:L-ascorbate metabolism protein UlaG (beta-lactamase superfamily)